MFGKIKKRWYFFRQAFNEVKDVDKYNENIFDILEKQEHEILRSKLSKREHSNIKERKHIYNRFQYLGHKHNLCTTLIKNNFK